MVDLKLEEKMKFRAKVEVLWLLVLVGVALLVSSFAPWPWAGTTWLPLLFFVVLVLGIAVGFYQFARKSPLE